MSENKLLELPVLVIREALIFPENTLPVSAGRSISVKAIQESRNNFESLIFVTNQISPSVDTITVEDIFDYGTLCRLTSYREKGKSISINVKAKSRVRFISIVLRDGCFYATGEILENEIIDPEIENKYYLEARGLAFSVSSLKDVVEKFESNQRGKNDFYRLAYTIFQAVPSTPDFLRSDESFDRRRSFSNGQWSH